MAIDPRISLAANAGNLGGAIGQGLLNARNIQAIQDRPLQNRLLQAKVGQAEQELSDAQQKAELQSIAMGLTGLDKFLQQGDLQGAENFLSEREASGPTVEGGRGMVDTQDMRAFIQPREGETEEQRLERVRARTNELKEGLYGLGVLERPKVDDITKKRLEEVRSEARGRNKEIDAKLSFVRDTKASLSDLADEIRRGNRTAVSSFFVKLVKTGDPNSAVLAGEMLSAMNLQGLAETAFKVARGEADAGAFESAAAAELAGLDPKEINLKDALNTADANLNSQTASIVDAFEMNQELLGRLTDEGRKDLSSEVRSRRIEELRGGGQPSWYRFIPQEARPTPDAVGAWAQKYGLTEDEALREIEDRLAKKYGVSGSKQ